MNSEKALPDSDPRCIACGRSGELEWHHVCGRFLFPTVEVPICRSRHIAIHALLRIAGVSLKSTEGRRPLMTVLCGFYALTEQIAPLTSDAEGFLASLRSRRERAAVLIERLSDENGANMGATLPARSNRRAPRERQRECEPCPPHNDRERIARLTAWCRWCLPALANLLDALLPTTILRDGVTDRLREVGRKADGLVLAGDAPEVAQAVAVKRERLEAWLLSSDPLPSLDELGHALADYVGLFGALADAADNKAAIQAVIGGH